MYWASCHRYREAGKELLIADWKQTWMAVSKGMRQCTGWATTGRKCQAESPILADRETVPRETLPRAH